MVNQKKINQAKLYQELLKKSPNFVLIGFKTISHQNLEKLRKELKKNNAFLKVIKNTIFEKAINGILNKNKILKEIKKNFFPLKENSALLTFKNLDYLNGLKTFFNNLKIDKNLYFKFGLLDNKIYESQKLIEISQLPSRNELLQKIIFLIKKPTFNFNNALKYNILKLINLLKQKSN